MAGTSELERKLLLATSDRNRGADPSQTARLPPSYQKKGSCSLKQILKSVSVSSFLVPVALFGISCFLPACGEDAADGAPSIEEAALPLALARAYCGAATPCCGAADLGTNVNCEADVETGVRSDLLEARQSGKVYNGTIAKQCVEAIRGLNCGSTDAQDDAADDICDRMALFQRQALLGESCSFAECAQGADYTASCEYISEKLSVCVGNRPAALGAPCDDRSASPGIGEARVLRVCESKVAYCSTKGICEPYPAVGQSCKEASRCVGEATCDVNELCVPTQRAGSQCAVNDDCTSRRCVAGRCSVEEAEIVSSLSCVRP